ncbi:MAG: hypothetical protein KGL39_01295 [Patescibacteria group bacterium]|nr:hypothetical protein [Patescibacteria group bacterium]
MMQINRKLALLTAKYAVDPSLAFVLAQGPDVYPKLVNRLALTVELKHVARDAVARGSVQMIEAPERSRHSKAVNVDGCDVHKLAADYGQLTVLRWLAKRDTTMFAWEWLGARVAKTGKLLALRWLVHRGMTLDGGTFERAAFGGHLHVLKYLLAKGVPWDARVTTAAKYSKRGRRVLEWLTANGCPVDPLREIRYGISHLFEI